MLFWSRPYNFPCICCVVQSTSLHLLLHILCRPGHVPATSSAYFGLSKPFPRKFSYLFCVVQIAPRDFPCMYCVVLAESPKLALHILCDPNHVPATFLGHVQAGAPQRSLDILCCSGPRPHNFPCILCVSQATSPQLSMHIL